MARARQGSLLVLAAALFIGALPAMGQQPPAAGDHLALPSPVPNWTVDGNPAADPELSGRAGREPLIDCGRDLPCRVRLRGVLGKNGGVALEATAFTW
jgi:hypothetical protein